MGFGSSCKIARIVAYNDQLQIVLCLSYGLGIARLYNALNNNERRGKRIDVE